MSDKAGTLWQSRFWSPLWAAYAAAPSIALCRVPELEYASRLNVGGRVLDHCCGDGRFALLAWPGRRLTAGCDRNPQSIELAKGRGVFDRADVCDAAARLPYHDGAFDLVFNNSALEHIPDLDATLREVARVLVPGGTFAFNVLNHRYFEWWPLDDEAKEGYRRWQPFFHAFDLDEWTRRLARAGLRTVSVRGYFDRRVSRELARLDCEFSGFYVTKRPSPLVQWYLRLRPVSTWYWRRRLAPMTWETADDTGAGYFIQAVRTNE